MPFVRFSRDKRGYEHIYLVHTAQGRARPGSARILYWYRTPPGVKVGREPFDESVRRALEAEYPNLQFDWPRIVNTPMPPVDAENWREKRRLMKEMRAARAAEEREAQREQGADAVGARAGGPSDGAIVAASEAHGAANVETDGAETHDAELYEGEANGAESKESGENEGGEPVSATADVSGSVARGPAGQSMEERRRRRRRGGRRRRRDGGNLPGQAPETTAARSASPAVSGPESLLSAQVESVSEPVPAPASDSVPDSSSESDRD